MNLPAGDLADDAHGRRKHQAILSEESQIIFFLVFISRLRLAQVRATRPSFSQAATGARLQPEPVFRVKQV
jgi:hypothetical protein